MNAFLDFVKAEYAVELSKITFSMLNAKTLTAYLAHLEASGNTVSTRHLRLTCIKAFFSYAADVEPTAVIHGNEISKVSAGKVTTESS